MLTLALWNNYLLGGLLVGFIAVCVLMVLAVLIQKPQGGGLAGAFGAGASSGQTAFGTKTGDALTLFTIGIFVLFLVFAVLLNLGMKPQAAGAGTTEVAPAGGTSAPASTTPAPTTTPEGTTTTTPAQPTGTEPAPTTPPASTETAPAGTAPAQPATEPQPAPQPAPEPAPTQPK